MRRHPYLHEKLNLLYALRANPGIRSNSDLARILGVSRQAVSSWCRGTATAAGDRLPDSHLDTVADLFAIDSSWLNLGIQDFEDAVKGSLLQQKASARKTPHQISIAAMPLTSLAIRGRDEELSCLYECWDDPRINVVELHGFGGMGKSALVNKWLSELSHDRYRGAQRVYAWSFHWQGQSGPARSAGDFFIEHALEWFGDPAPLAGTPWAKANRLARLMRQDRTLLVLDGLEALQQPPGPKIGEIDNPALSALVRELATENSGLCVTTSRLNVADLTPYKDGRVKTMAITGLSAPASGQLLRELGVIGDRESFATAVGQYAGHPLSLVLLGGYLSIACQGKIQNFKELPSLLQDKRLRNQVRNLIQIYVDWFQGGPELELLLLIALFDRAIDLGTLRRLAAEFSIPHLTAELGKLTEPEWYYPLEQLKQAQLITVQWESEEPTLDCHPLVRDSLERYLEAERNDTWQQGHKLIFRTLQRNCGQIPKSLSDMEPLFRAVIHGTQAGCYLEAFQLYHERIKAGQFSLSTEGNHYVDHRCLRAFFERPWVQPLDCLPEEAGVFLLSSAATNLIYLGRIEEAIVPSQQAIAWFIAHDRWMEAVTAAAPVVSMLIVVGRLKEATALIAELSPAIRKAENAIVRAMAANFRAYLAFLGGDVEAARDWFSQSEAILTQSVPVDPAPFPTISAYYCKFLLDTENPRQALERLLKTFAWRQRKAWQVKVDTTSLLASDKLVLGLTFLKLGDHINAKKYLDEQIAMFRSADEWLYLPTGLNSRARYYIHQQDFDSAARDLKEALEISQRTGAIMGLWEACLEFANLHFQRGEYDLARDFLGRADALPGMQAYHFRDHEIQTLQQQLAC